MKTILFWLVAIAGILQAFIGLSFFVSSIWEKERRASIFGGLQFLIMLAGLVLIIYLYTAGFFSHHRRGNGSATGIVVGGTCGLGTGDARRDQYKST